MQCVPTAKSADARPVRVLIADDSSVVRQSLSALISRLSGVEIVGHAGTGDEALELLRSLKPDAVTLDIRMPKLNGIGVLESIKREQMNVMPIILSGVVEEEYRRKCLELGATHFFHKATEFELLIDLLTELGSQRRARC